MASRDLTFKVRAEDQASRVFKDAEKAVKSLGDAEDDARTKAQKLADEMKAAAQRIQSEMRSAQEASDALGNALGSDLVAKLNATGSSVDEQVMKFRNVGLSFDEIRAEADVLADALRHASDVGKTVGDDIGAGAREARADLDALSDAGRRVGDDIDVGARKARAGLDDMRVAGDQSTSVMANLAGNTAQDIANIGGASSTTGMALGQLAEYASEGGISLKNLARTGVPMGALAALGIGLAGSFERLAKTKAFENDEVEAFKKSLQGTASAVDAVEAKLREVGEIRFRWDEFLDVDAMPAINAAGLNVERFSELVAGGQEEIDAWAASQRAAGVDAGAVGLAALAAGQQVEFYGKAVEAAAESEKFFRGSMTQGELEKRAAELKHNADMHEYVQSRIEAHAEAEEDVADAVDRSADAVGQYGRDLERQRGNQDDATEAAERRKQAEEDLYNQLLGQVDSQYAYIQQVRDTRTELDQYNEKVKEGKLSQDELATETERARQSLEDAAVSYANASGAAEGTQGWVDKVVESLSNQRDALAPGSPLYAAVDGYIKLLKNIPTDIATRLSLDIRGAQVRVDPNTGRIRNSTAGTGQAAQSDTLIAGATGGIVTKPTIALIGEAGPEAIIPLNKAPGASPLPSSLRSAGGLSSPGARPVPQLEGLLVAFAAEKQAAEAAAKAAAEAKKAREDAAKAAEDASDAEVERWQLELEFGEISRDEYLRRVRERAATETKWSDDWVALQREVRRVEADIAGEAAKSAEDAHKAALDAREKAERAYLENVEKMYEDAGNRRRANDEARQTDEAMAALNEAGRKAALYGLDPKRDADERAAAAEEFERAKERAAEQLYERADALANAAGVRDGTPEWAASVWAALLGDMQNAPALAPYIQRILDGIPRFDNGGVMPGPRGQHSLAMVAGGETILPTHRGGGLGGVQNLVVFGQRNIRQQVASELRLFEQRSRFRSRLVS